MQAPGVRNGPLVGTAPFAHRAMDRGGRSTCRSTADLPGGAGATGRAGPGAELPGESRRPVSTPPPPENPFPGTAGLERRGCSSLLQWLLPVVSARGPPFCGISRSTPTGVGADGSRRPLTVGRAGQGRAEPLVQGSMCLQGETASSPRPPAAHRNLYSRSTQSPRIFGKNTPGDGELTTSQAVPSCVQIGFGGCNWGRGLPPVNLNLSHRKDRAVTPDLVGHGRRTRDGEGKGPLTTRCPQIAQERHCPHHSCCPLPLGPDAAPPACPPLGRAAGGPPTQTPPWLTPETPSRSNSKQS